MKKIISLLLVITMFVSMTVGVSAEINNTSKSAAQAISFGKNTTLLSSDFEHRAYYKITVPYTGIVTFDFSAYCTQTSYSVLEYEYKFILDGFTTVYFSPSSKHKVGNYYDAGRIRLELDRGEYSLQIYKGGSAGTSKYKFSWLTTFDCIHENTTTKTTVEPTCSSTGTEVTTCNNCRETVRTDTLSRLPHTPEDEWTRTKEPTCSAKGEEEKKCTVCGGVADTQDIDKLDHTYGEWVTDSEPTCSKEGKRTRVCSVCGGKDTEEIDKLDHDYGDWEITDEATCTSKGKETRKCKSCGKSETNNLDMLDHDYGKWETTTEATCTKAGKESRECKSCGKTETQSIDMLDHDYGKWEETVEATCTSTGKETRKCKNCSNSETRTTDKIDHDYDDWTVITKATCTSVGKEQGYCKLCDKTITENIPMLDHDYGEWKVTTEATCTSKGKKSATCEDCGRTGTETIDKTAHTVEEWTVTKEATEKKRGTRKGKCSVCGKSVTENYELPKYPGRDGFKPSREYGKNFKDVTEDKWFFTYVETAYEYTLVNGMSQSSFSPESKFTVAQALTTAANIHCAYYGNKVDAAKDGEQWYEPYVNYCIENGIITEEQFGDYTKNITRGEMAAVYAGLLPSEEYSEVREGTVADMNGEMANYKAVEKLYRAGIVSGDAGTGKYRPDDEIIRSEACVIFTRIAVASYRAK